MRSVVRYGVTGLVSLTIGLRSPASEPCDVLVAALASVGADSSNAVLIDQTGMGVPQFAFNAYSGIRRGDTSLARTAQGPLASANRTRVPLPACLRQERGWTVVGDSVLFGIFQASGDRWARFHERFPGRLQFVLLSQPVLVADTALVYVGIARGPLDGRGVILRLQRMDGRWSKTSEMQLWIS